MKREQLLAKSTQAETVIILLVKCGVLFMTNMVQLVLHVPLFLSSRENYQSRDAMF